MGRRGPKAEPAAIRDQKAAVRSQRTKSRIGLSSGNNQDGDGSNASAGAAPSWLKKDGLQIWNRLSPILRSAKLLTDADLPAFSRYCRNYARWLKMQREMDRLGESYETDGQFGKMKRVNPAFLISDRTERMLLAFEDRFGLNPAERQRIFVARAQTGVSGDLFSSSQPSKPSDRRDGDPAADPTAPAAPEQGPVGFLN